MPQILVMLQKFLIIYALKKTIRADDIIIPLVIVITGRTSGGIFHPAQFFRMLLH